MSRTIGDYTFNSNEVIGQGTLGNLVKGANKKTGQEVVLRLLQKALLKDDQIMSTALKEEMAIMQKLKNHPKITPILEVIESENFYYIVFPYYPANLQQILKKQKRFTEAETIKLMNDLIDGFSELVKQGIIHRDLKPSNILYDNKNFIISDPGFAKTLESFRKDSKSKPQNFFYVAPQVLEPKPKYTNKCDIWSLGMVLFECVTGVLPFYASTNDEHLKFCKSKKIEVPENVVSKNMKSFIEGCLVYQEDRRFDWTKILAHPIINPQLKDKNADIQKSNKKYLMTQIRQKIIKKNLNLQDVYNKLDQNQNGLLDIDEFTEFINKIDKKVSYDDCKYIFQQIDKDGSDSISFDEFKLWISGNNTRMAIFKIQKPKSTKDFLNQNAQPPTFQQPKYNKQPQTPPQQYQQPNQITQTMSQPYFQPPPPPLVLQMPIPQKQPALMTSSISIPAGAGFGRTDKLERSILMIKQIIKQRQLDTLNLFQSFDFDKDSFLSFSEFQQLIWSLNPQQTVEEIADMFKVFNLNNDEYVSFVEFRLVTSMASEKRNIQMPPNINQQPIPFIPNSPFPLQVYNQPPQPQPVQYKIPPNIIQQPPYQNQQYSYPIQNISQNQPKQKKSKDQSQLLHLGEEQTLSKKKQKQKQREAEKEKKRQQTPPVSYLNVNQPSPRAASPGRPPKLAQEKQKSIQETPKYHTNSNSHNTPLPSPKQPQTKFEEQPKKPSPVVQEKYQPRQEEILQKPKSFSPIVSTNHDYNMLGSKLDPDMTQSTPILQTSQIPANFNNRPYRKVLNEKIDNFYYSHISNVKGSEKTLLQMIIKQQNWIDCGEQVSQANLVWNRKKQDKWSQHSIHRPRSQIHNKITGIGKISWKAQTTISLRSFSWFYPLDIYPESYIYPNERDKIASKNVRNFIAKPSSGSEGKGIFFPQSYSDFCKKADQLGETIILQKYIQNPMLLGKRKFDLRFYVMISKIDPFICYLNKEGLVRVCAEEYSKQNVNQFSHLTNYAINCESSNYVACKDDFIEDQESNKRSFQSLRHQLKKEGQDPEILFNKIEDLIAQFLQAIYPSILYYGKVEIIEKYKNFCIIGLDIMLDDAGKPYILEMNSQPSLQITQEINNKIEISPFDYYVKELVVKDAIMLATKNIDWRDTSYKLLSDEYQLENNSVRDLLNLFWYCGNGNQTLSCSQFCKISNFSGMINEQITRTEYQLIFCRCQVQRIDFFQFLELIVIIAKKMNIKLPQLVQMIRI